MMTQDGALAVRCPQCKAYAHSPCVYMSDKPARSRWDRVRREYITISAGEVRIGKPLANGNVHTERRALARRRASTARFKAQVPKVSKALLAVRRFDLEEYQQMQAWLRRWGPTLWSPPGALVLCPDCGIASCDGNCEYERLSHVDQ